ncbi:hypothetical protein RF11_14114 [Thelohanellus kitauei]|uniref:Uncharacterized protein n=1 Tax=Thelohanellus kitauei TaxID=669202 RepID=A0A0C2JCF4_THEKT|nr:hypothetical protein RF11_14114 [Thelohanellus kitauei]
MVVAKDYNVQRHSEYNHREFEQYIGNLSEDKLADLERPLKKQHLSRNTIAERVVDVAHDLESQRSRKKTIYISLMESLDRLGVDWKNAESLVTGGEPQMIGRKLQKLNVKPDFCNFDCIVHQESLCSLILKVGNMKGCPVADLSNNARLTDLSFLVDIMEHINELSRKTHGRNKLLVDLYERIYAFGSKFELWEKKFGENNPFHFPTLKSLLSDMGLLMMFTRIITLCNRKKPVHHKYTNSSRGVTNGKNRNSMLFNLKDRFDSVDNGKLYTSTEQKYPMLNACSARIFSIFRTTYTLAPDFEELATAKRCKIYETTNY